MSESPSPQQNCLLAALPAEALSRLLPHLQLVPLTAGETLCESGGVLEYAYFPVDCMVAMLYVTESGASSEASVVGNEGMVGISLVMGGERTQGQATVVCAGSAYRLQRRLIGEEFNRHGEMLRLILRHTQCLMTQIAQTVACNRHHSVQQQLCRLLLLTLDRLPESNELVMTQELIANMLGVRREGVTEAASKLKRLNVITYRRGHITVLNRRKLEALSCECYAVVKRETDRLLPCAPPCTRSIQPARTLRRPVGPTTPAYAHRSF